MIRRMTPYTHYRFTTAKDNYGEQVKEWDEVGTVEMTLSLTTGTQSSMNNILTSSSTHIGVTDSKNIVIGDKLQQAAAVYLVDFVVADGRKTMVYLAQEN